MKPIRIILIVAAMAMYISTAFSQHTVQFAEIDSNGITTVVETKMMSEEKTYLLKDDVIEVIFHCDTVYYDVVSHEVDEDGDTYVVSGPTDTFTMYFGWKTCIWMIPEDKHIREFGDGIHIIALR